MDETLDPHGWVSIWNWFNFDDLDDEIFNMDETLDPHGWVSMELVQF
jgi:hypothetical protein